MGNVYREPNQSDTLSDFSFNLATRSHERESSRLRLTGAVPFRTSQPFSVVDGTLFLAQSSREMAKIVTDRAGRL